LRLVPASGALWTFGLTHLPCVVAGSSRGRGNRAAGWFADYIHSQNDTVMKSLVLDGGIKAWVAAGEKYIQLMDEYEPAVWHK
jgi:arsenical-resistance protein 2